MNAVKKVFSQIAEFLGFKKNTKYVNEYIHRANIRSGVFMSMVVAVLEVWLVFRQHQKYIIPQVANGANYFDSLFKNTSLFWLQMVMGLSMFFYCLFYLREKPNKGLMVSVLITSAIGIVLCSLLPLENRIKNYNPKRLVDTIFLITLYASIFIYHCTVIVASITRFKGKKIDWLHSVAVITIFATCLLIFGIKVSYSDFTSTTTVEGVVVPNPDYKEIICFLMMSIYVGCLLIWRPYISVAILGVIFLGFYRLLKTFDPEIRYFPDGDTVNYLTFFISLVMVSISIFSQRKLEARKDEELEILATKDKLTGLLAFEYFCTLCSKKIKNEEIKDREYIYLFVDLTSFKIFNDQRGFEQGNIFLRKVGEILTEVLPDALISRQSDDHFVVFVSSEGIKEKMPIIDDKVRALDPDIRPGIKVGGYYFEGIEEDPHSSIEKARYACANAKQQAGVKYLRYGHEMQEEYAKVQYIVNHIDEAVQNGWIVVYYQPVVYSKDLKLCGTEALARWIDPKYGFLSPGTFVKALEDAQLAYKLDLAMLEAVCKNMRKMLDAGETVVPTSINFSRADFSIINVPEEVKRITGQYSIDPKYLHIEITESALLDGAADLKAAMTELQKNGFAIWLDDFGSGYSSFNALKDYAFDVLKLDMEFLKGFEANKKSKPLIKSVIDMANQIGMRTLAEGVETDEHVEFLKSIGCEKLQGYRFSKPVPYEELHSAIDDGKFVIAKNLFK